jgi:hypothetical protein
MNLACPEKSIESEQIAETPFLGGSFLTDTLERSPEGVMTVSQYISLLNSAMKEGKLTKGEAFSFAMFKSNLQSEYCYALQRYIFYTHKYIKTPNAKTKAAVQKWNQYVQDMIASLEYSEEIQEKGAEENLVTPTESMRPLSYQALGISESFQSGESKYTKQKVELREHMTNLSDGDIMKLEKDMVVYTKEKNKAATNLLATYAFLNLTAVGLLLYIFRAK